MNEAETLVSEAEKEYLGWHIKGDSPRRLLCSAKAYDNGLPVGFVAFDWRDATCPECKEIKAGRERYRKWLAWKRRVLKERPELPGVPFELVRAAPTRRRA